MKCNRQTETETTLMTIQNNDDTIIKELQHIKQILAKMIQAEHRTIHYEILELISSIWNRDEKSQYQ